VGRNGTGQHRIVIWIRFDNRCNRCWYDQPCERLIPEYQGVRCDVGTCQALGKLGTLEYLCEFGQEGGTGRDSESTPYRPNTKD
jgi:hypothetical protein